MKSTKIILGDVAFDPTTRTVFHKDGHPARLRHKSLEVLSYLVAHPGRTVSKNEILDHIWANVAVSDESLFQCIADIRRLIGPRGHNIVENVPREGYRLNLASDEARIAMPSRTMTIGLAGLALVGIAAVFLWPEAPTPQRAETESIRTQAASGPPRSGNTEAYLEVLQGSISANRFAEAESLIAERHFRRAIELDPDYARAHAELGALFAVRFENDWTVLKQADIDKAFFFAERAIDLQPDLWMGHYALGRLYSIVGDLELAATHLQNAMKLKPDGEDARAYLGAVRNFQGDSDAAVAILEPAVASHPNPPYWYFLSLGNALLLLERYEEAETALNRCLELATNSPYCLRYIIALFGHTGQIEKAKGAIDAYASLGFDTSSGAIFDLLSFHQPEQLSFLLEGFRSAGLPE